MPYSLERWLAGRWIAGPSMTDALERAVGINKRGISVLINYLGEDFTRKVDVDDSVETDLRLITEIRRSRLKGDISVKPTQIGLCISQKLFKENYVKIAEHAKMNGVFVWLDMEGPHDVERIIDTYLEVQKHITGGICIQSYLKRSMDDLKRIVKAGGIVRLVKGAYGFKKGEGMIEGRGLISLNYMEMMKYLFAESERFTIATHDRYIVEKAIMLNKTAHRKVTYAMLNGIENQYAKRLAARGESVALYLPFGTRWVGYSYRRMKEIGHIRLILHSLLKSQEL
ncbi:MAG: proline dehydrogenase family protein [Candidatus Micrarchaeota archaeon]|nr:proline dehydrogenase family protein [Candidatus Micrarchaeota archaeon]